MIVQIKNMVFDRRFFILSVCLWLLLQFVYVYHFKYVMLVNDPGVYVSLAMDCLSHGTMYPDYSNYYHAYIFQPGWVNAILLWLHLFGDTNNMVFLNIIFNALIVILIYNICRIIVPQRKEVSYVSVYFIMLIPSNFTICLHLFSEPLFELLSLASFYFVLRNNLKTSCFAGILIGLAMWTRPLGLAWIIAATFYYLWKPTNIRPFIGYIVCYCLTCGSIAVLTHRNFPDYIYKANTGGINLVMGANDHATGFFCYEALKKGGLGYLPGDSVGEFAAYLMYGDKYRMANIKRKYNYKQNDSIRTTRAIKWIKDHPQRWFSMLPKKLVNLYYSAPTFVYSYDSKFDDDAILKRIFNVCISIANKPHKLLMILFVLGLFFVLWREKGYIYLVLPIMFVTLATIATVSSIRYNYIVLPYLYIGASITLFYGKKIFKIHIPASSL